MVSHLSYSICEFGYLHEFRMEKSKEELGVDGTKISDVAQRMGYKHATHFTAAFKKYYGYLPNKMRLGILHLLHFSDYAFELAGQISGEGVFMETL